MKYLSLTAALLILTGCVTTADFDRLGSKLATSVNRSVSTVLDAQEGKITAVDARRIVTAEQQRLQAEVDAGAAKLASSVDGVAGTIQAMLPEGSIASLIAVMGLNYWRNRNRRKRGEVVAVEAAEKGAKA